MRQYFCAGDSHLIVEFGNTISIELNREVHTLAAGLNDLHLLGVNEVVPSYCSLMISYNPLLIGVGELIAVCKGLERVSESSAQQEVQIIEVPVCYGGEFGPDLEQVAAETNLTTDEVVALHTKQVYTVYMVGFLPGFPYLGSLNPRLALPRLKVPRTKVPAGSVAITELQTGVYPVCSPGGWRLLGRTPLKFFDPWSQPPALVAPGMRVSFRAVTEQEYLDISASLAQGRFKPKITREDVPNA